MAKLTTQLLIKITPELNERIEGAFKKHLKRTGEYITKSEFIRRILERECAE
jgi:hypothetical protein